MNQPEYFYWLRQTAAPLRAQATRAGLPLPAALREIRRKPEQLGKDDVRELENFLRQMRPVLPVRDGKLIVTESDLSAYWRRWTSPQRLTELVHRALASMAYVEIRGEIVGIAWAVAGREKQRLLVITASAGRRIQENIDGAALIFRGDSHEPDERYRIVATRAGEPAWALVAAIPASLHSSPPWPLPIESGATRENLAAIGWIDDTGEPNKEYFARLHRLRSRDVWLSLGKVLSRSSYEMAHDCPVAANAAAAVLLDLESGGLAGFDVGQIPSLSGSAISSKYLMERAKEFEVFLSEEADTSRSAPRAKPPPPRPASAPESASAAEEEDVHDEEDGDASDDAAAGGVSETLSADDFPDREVAYCAVSASEDHPAPTTADALECATSSDSGAPVPPPERRVSAELRDRRADKAVPKENGLTASMPLRLRVRIGKPFAGSQMREAPPPIDPTLPPTRDAFYEVSVIVFAKDFKLESADEQKVRLPALAGDSDTADFDLAAPAELMPLAELRFGIYHENQLLQAFHLRAQMQEESKPVRDGWGIDIGCDFSQTRRFAGLDTFQPRLISIAVNDDASGSHTLMIKGSQVKETLYCPEKKLERANDAARAALQKAVNGHTGSPNFLFDSATLALTQSAASVFGDSIRDLAEIGWELFSEVLLRGSGGMLDLLKQIRESEGQTLQIAMLHGGHALFPWPLVYDLPPGADAAAGTVCLGDEHCACGTTPKGYCLRGFWGMRHGIEQLATLHTSADGQARIAAAPLAIRVRFRPVISDVFVSAGITALQKLLSAGFAEAPATDALLEDLRPSANRPEIFAIVCHGEEQPTRLSRETVLLAHSRPPPVNARAIAAEILQPGNPWQEPHSLILLLACGSNAERLDTATGVARAFLSLGAGGVIGTECAVDTGLIARFARDLITLLHKEKLPVGEAMRRFTLSLAQEGCPLGFVFTYLGSANLRLPA